MAGIAPSVAPAAPSRFRGAPSWRFTVLLGVILRLAPFILFPGLSASLRDRVELVTPVSRFSGAAEAAFMADRGASPYAGGFFRGSPLVLAAVRPLVWSEAAVFALLVAADVAVAACVRLVARRAGGWEDLAAAVALLNPVTVCSCIALSLGPLAHLPVVAALAAAAARRPAAAGAALGAAVAVDPYAALLLPPAAMSAARGHKGGTRRFALAAAAALGVAAAASERLAPGWWPASHGFVAAAPDLTPGLGPFWYLFQLLFPRFRGYFLALLHLHLVAYVGPLCVRFGRDRPLFAAYVVFALCSVFRSYPAAGDTALALALLVPHLPRLLPHARPAVRVVAWVWFANALVLLNQWWMWIGSGSGNANFFYFQTVIYMFCHSFVVLEAVACARRDQAEASGAVARMAVAELGKPKVE